ncbi:unnamed protein product [Ambrosiozyma monospora]|uniref:Unnamed protein product n=1 Tax=Ambrosiozyma monospora TaxID=43982 RepID=A0ACB5TP65_AMBMO|nr:unnamed protein product [Ambrosiozyma monospora]
MPVLYEKGGETYFPTDREWTKVLKLDSVASIFNLKKPKLEKILEFLGLLTKSTYGESLPDDEMRQALLDHIK